MSKFLHIKQSSEFAIIKLDFLTTTPHTVYLVPYFRTARIFHRDKFFSHTLYDLAPYGATGIRTHVKELHLFEGP